MEAVLAPIAAIAAVLTEIITAIGYALILFAVFVIVRLISETIAAHFDDLGAPFSAVANAIRNAADSAARTAQNRLSSWAQSGVSPLTRTLDQIGTNLRSSATSARNVAWQLAAAIYYLSKVVIPHTIQGVNQALTSNVTNITNVVNNVTNTTIQSVDNAIGQSVDDTQAWAGELYNAGTSYTYDVARWADSRLSALEGNLNQYIQAVDSYVQQAYTQAVNFTEQEANSIRSDVTTDIDNTYNQLASSITSIEEWAQQEIEHVSATEAADVGALATVLTTNVVPWINTFADFWNNCLGGDCTPLSNLLKDVGAVESLIELGGIFALLAYFITQPDSAGQETADIGNVLLGGPFNFVASHLPFDVAV